jgi:hypothetical protein
LRTHPRAVPEERPDDFWSNVEAKAVPVLLLAGLDELSGPKLFNGSVTATDKEAATPQQESVRRINDPRTVIDAWRVIYIAKLHQLKTKGSARRR